MRDSSSPHRLYLGLLAVLGGCAPASPPAHRSAQIQAYAGALASGQADACAALEDTALQGDCLTAVAGSQASRGHIRDAHATCMRFSVESSESLLWRDECLFQLVDAAELRGADALATCQELSTFSSECLSHVAARAVEEDILRYARPGTERLVHQQTFSTLRRYMDAASAEVMAQDMVTRWVVQRRNEDAPFDPRDCGQLGLEMCAHVYERMVRGPEGVLDPSAAWRQDCQRPLSAELARAHGLPRWVPGAEQVVQQAWFLLCSL